MADTKITSLPAAGGAAADDLLLLVADPSGTPVSKKITYANLTVTLATLTGSETLTNKTLTLPKINENVALTATATELNYVDGVTSAIQTQLDAKASLISPSFTTPALNVATATSINKVTITAPAASATLTIANTGSLITSGAYAITFTATGATGVTLPTSGTLATLAGAETLAAKTLTTPVIASFYQDAGLTKLMTTPNTASDTLAAIAATQTLTNKRVTKRAPTVTQSATPAINTDVTDVAHITGLAQAITSMTSSLTGTPVEGDTLRIDITDNGTARAITWGASFESSGTVTLPATTVLGVRLDVGFVWNSVTNKWRCVAVA